MMKMKTPQKDLLARAYLDILAAECGSNAKPMLRGTDPDDPVDALLEDLSGAPDAAPKNAVRADLAATAVMVARAIENVTGLTRDLRRASPVITIATHSPEMVMLVRDVVKYCAFGNDAKVLSDFERSSGYDRPVLLMTRDGAEPGHRADRGNDVIATALHANAPIVGVAPEPKRHLPRDLLRAREHSLSLGQLDEDAIRLVVEVVTGQVPTSAIEERLVAAVDIGDLVIAVRTDRNANACIERLADVVAKKSLFDHRGPSLEELHGYGAAREWGLNLVADLRDFKAGRREWASLEHSVLLAGPPGVGKSTFATALAKSAGIPLITTSVADWNAASFLSGTLAAIKAVFEQARKLGVCVMLIDEIDGINDRATLPADYREYWTQIVNLLLTSLSEERPGCVVIAASNHPHRIDAAIRRAGRLDRTIEIPLPSIDDLVHIFRHHLGETLKDADLTPLALAAVGGSGADVKAWVTRAKNAARRANAKVDLDRILAEIRGGKDPLSPSMRRQAAVHEAGHLVVGVALEVCDVGALSLVDDGGWTRAKVYSDRAQTEQGIENLMTMMLGGRAAEEIVFGREARTAGAGVGPNSDLARATECALDLELRHGMGSMGLIHFSDRVTEMLANHPRVIEVVQHRLDRCLQKARDVLGRNNLFVAAVASALNEKGYLGAEEIAKLLAEFPLSPESVEVTRVLAKEVA